MSSPVISGLQQAVANTYVLVSLTQAAHWNLIGPDFFQLHAALGSQYEALFDTVDLLAERIRALDSFVDVSLTLFEKQAGMAPMSPSFSAKGMVMALIEAHGKNVADLAALCGVAREAGDSVTENMVLGLIEGEQKTIWQLRSWTR